MAFVSMLSAFKTRCSGGILRRFYSVVQPHPEPLPENDLERPVLSKVASTAPNFGTYLYDIKNQFYMDFADMLSHPDYFNVKDMFTIAQLFEARVHFGHKITSLDDRMKPFIYGERAGHAIFNLNITAFHLQQALNFLAHVTLQGGIILFVARSPENGFFIEETAKECGEYAHVRKWHEGTLLNIPGLQIGDVRLPDCAVFLTTSSEMRQQHLGVKECAKLNIPTIAIVDSNCNPNQISYPVPGNDDTYTSIQFLTNLFKEAILRGKRERQRRFDIAEKLSQQKSDQKSLKCQIVKN